MKLTMLGILTVLLVATLAAPAAAATLASGSYIADVIAVGPSGLLVNNTICGRVVVSPKQVSPGVFTSSIVLSVDFRDNDAVTGIDGCDTGIPNPALGTGLDLCYRNRNNDLEPAALWILRDNNNNGKIDGLEGILKGKIPAGVGLTTFEIHSTSDGTCGGDVLFRTGYRQPS